MTEVEDKSAVIWFTLGVNSVTAEHLVNACMAMKQQGFTHIHLGISSPGGNINAGFAAYNRLSSLGLKFTTYNLGVVNSIALLFYSLGTRRIVAPTASFLFHGVFWTFAFREDVPFALITEAYSTLKTQQDVLQAELARATGVDTAQINTWCGGSSALSPDEAIAKGFAHELGVLKPISGAPLCILSDAPPQQLQAAAQS